MTLPASFIKDGFVLPGSLRRTRRLMIGTDGPSNSGKTEFAISAPGPGIVIGLDRGFDAMLDNPNPPPTRQGNFAFKAIPVPLATQAKQDTFKEYWRAFYHDTYLKALNNSECRTVVIDGDSDSWELQRLAEFGKLLQIPPIMYSGVNAARRAMYARAWDSGKIVIATNKIKRDYQPVLLADGTPDMKDGKPVREWDGKAYERQGFPDQDYLFSIQLRHLYEPAGINGKTGKAYEARWGIKILKCKADPDQEGTELWGDDCNFQTLVELVYPNVTLAEWGYK